MKKRFERFFNNHSIPKPIMIEEYSPHPLQIQHWETITKMNKYARSQEDRAARHWDKAGFDVERDTGRLTQGAGDHILQHRVTGLTIVADHKSTRNEKGIRIEKQQLEKIAEETKDNEVGIPCITFSYLDSKEVYAVFAIKDLKGVLS